ncbi:TPA: hypothetical protein I8412_002558 [Citrobacter freundii]|jgi:hypothetical protein|uniref:Uncharacterized protein n=9 Tax=Enterobacteriaceae TaxID=543 RepID=J7FQ51_CITFR|nr:MULTISPECIES: hypothetical protein [Enterobacteriaceae]EFP8475175.1 hypothetical protein [Shigella boydii]EFV0703795.1 hypothetical protein [Salmonella enterica]EHG4429104.1 hypothetical protein [Salmonella enterica subsp. enterica serovar Virchow]EHM7841131.1 hypothetical protein [Salmonella enterica subsp. enterica serovar Senftenberg]EHN4004477.1 hypothetical protein [Salmonella enterica subsp. enterica serovar Kentucky]EIT0808740.1 hypothetical protein [Salmonella enterica subsp. enter
MSHNIFIAEFDDGLRMYGINDGTACHMHAFLFQTQAQVEHWLGSGDRDTRKLPVMPENASLTEENVTIGPDETWAFRSRASRTAQWITGPLEHDSESWEDQSVYGHST